VFIDYKKGERLQLQLPHLIIKEKIRKNTLVHKKDTAEITK
jgi:hypothetical protein